MILEILIIVIGIALVVAGYLIPSREKDDNSKIESFSRDQVKEMVSEEVEAAKGQITDLVDETITYAMEKTERSMDRLSNEKMMAVSEYSDTVLDQISKSHEEVVFLYDMLNDKHENLKETVAEAAKTASEVAEKLKEAEDLSPIVVTRVQEPEGVNSEEDKKTSQPRTRNKPVPVIKTETISPVSAMDEESEEEDSSWEDEWDDFDDEEEYEEIIDGEGPEITFSTRSPGSRNNNERILELHKAGKSNMAIAKELGLGVGEVKLVIDLFKGSKA